MDFPPNHKWSEVDSYLHKLIRDLADDVKKMREQPINPEVQCTAEMHYVVTALGHCICGRFDPAKGFDSL